MTRTRSKWRLAAPLCLTLACSGSVVEGSGKGEGDASTGDASTGDESEAATSDPEGSDGGCEGGCPGDQICMAGACVDPGCTPGDACVAENPCFTGVIACDGPPSCVPGAPAPAGVPCGAGRVCSGDGACVPCGEGTPCSVNHPCQRGALACDSGSPVCEPAGFEPLGAPCEEGNVCDGLGACLVPPDCMVLRAAYPEATSGVYIVDFDGAGPGPTREVFCDMELEGGGWTLWPAPEVDALPANAGLPRCGMSLGVSCYAGAFVGRGYRDGVYKIPDGNTALALQNDLSWKALGAGGEQRDGCKDVEYCKAGNDRCLFSLLLDGSGCCTDPDQFNFCLQ